MSGLSEFRVLLQNFSVILTPMLLHLKRDLHEHFFGNLR